MSINSISSKANEGKNENAERRTPNAEHRIQKFF